MNKEWDSPKKHRELVEREKRRSEQRKAEGKSPTDAPFSQSVMPGLAIKGAKEGRWFQEWCEQWSKELFRVLKPGGYFLSFSATRMYHRMVCGIEDAGFEIRDCIQWIYGSGFPKSLNIGKSIDKMQGNEREKLGFKKGQGNIPNDRGEWGLKPNTPIEITKGNTEWEGWGTALKPACEPIVVARKPLSEKNVALNVLKWGTGGINIDACRISLEGEKQPVGSAKRVYSKNQYTEEKVYGKNKQTPQQGRFPANIILDEFAGQMLDEQSGVSSSSDTKRNRNTLGSFGMPNDTTPEYSDKGGASRFFYCAKASKSERNKGCEELEEKKQDSSRKEGNPGGDNPRNRGVHLRKNNHPTVKPIKLMEYLIKLVSREGATILDPFLGSGTTGIVAVKLCRNFIDIEKEEEYVKIAQARLKPFLEQQRLQ